MCRPVLKNSTLKLTLHIEGEWRPQKSLKKENEESCWSSKTSAIVLNPKGYELAISVFYIF